MISGRWGYCCCGATIRNCASPAATAAAGGGGDGGGDGVDGGLSG